MRPPAARADGDQLERLRALWGAPNLAMFVVDPAECVVDANPCFRRLLEAGDTWQARPLNDLLAREAEGPTATARTLPLSRCVQESVVLPFRARAGRVVWLTLCGVPYAGDARGGRIVFLGHDVTAQQEREAARRAAETAEQLADGDDPAQRDEREREAQRMEAIGRLAGGVAHDFNNRLTVILGHANLIRFGAASGANVVEHVNVIEAAALRAAQLTQQLLGFARQGKLQNVPVDMHRVIMDVMNLLRCSVDKRVTLQQVLDAPQAWVQGDPTQLQQVLLNLAANAVDAMPSGGELRFTTRTARSAAGNGADGEYVVVAVQDTGVGMSEDVRARMFEPFFTTKPPHAGAGMGLPMVYGIVRNHGGHVSATSEPGRGATFEVYLPARRLDGADVMPPEPVAADAACVLVVDDEPIVRDVLVRMLRQMGYRSVAATNGQEAAEYYEAHGAGVDVVLMDMVMPVMNGRDCCRALRRINPDVRIIVATGHDVEESAVQREGLVVQGRLHKPFSMQALAAELSRVLAG